MDLVVLDAEIGGDHLRIGLDLGGRALRDLAPVIEHDDVVRNAHDDAHVVLDQKDRQRMLFADLEKQVVQLAGFARVEACRRLVEAKKHGRGAHGARDFEAALRAIGKVAGWIVGAGKKADLGKPMGRTLDRGLLGALVAFEAEKAAKRVAGGGVQRIVLSHKQIFEHGHTGEQPDVLEGAGDARRSRDLEARHALQKENRAVRRRGPSLAAEGRRWKRGEGCAAFVGERDAPFCGLIEARNAVENRGLACAVRADDGGDVAAFCRERESIDGEEAAEAHGELLHAQNFVFFRGRIHAHEPRPSLTKLADRPGAPCNKADGVRAARSPRRRQIMTSTIESPKISMR